MVANEGFKEMLRSESAMADDAESVPVIEDICYHIRGESKDWDSMTESNRKMEVFNRLLGRLGLPKIISKFHIQTARPVITIGDEEEDDKCHIM